MAAVLDVIRGFNPGAASRFPVRWPNENASVYLRRVLPNASPNPLTHCPGYDWPIGAPEVGLPVILQLGTGSAISAGGTPQFETRFLDNGVERQHCVFDENTYLNSNPAEQESGRAILAARDAIVLIPRQPLDYGHTYTVSIRAYGQINAWSFRVVPPP
jgi:hypothetical protein